MSTPYIGEIRIFGGNFAPLGWAFCAGQLLAIAQYDALFNLIGTTYGGDGVTTFGLPDLRGRIPVHQGTLAPNVQFVIGQASGVETVTLSSAQIPVHTHPLLVDSAAGTANTPLNGMLAAASSDSYATTLVGTGMNTRAIGVTGASQPHDNVQPYLCMNFIIALEGIYPSQS
jgi:microcystin-dependent protein